MARKRMIDPSFWSDEKLGKMNPLVRLLFMGLISNADDEGRLPGHPALVKSQIFPYDTDITNEKVDEWLRELDNKGSIKVYHIKEETYIQVLKFSKYQTINRKTPSKYPAYDEKQFSEGSVSNHESVNESSLPIEENRKEEKLKEDEEKENTLSPDIEALELCKYYETLKPMQSITSELPSLKIFIEKYTFDWTKEAIQMCVSKKGKFIQPWIETVLKNWTAEGKETKKGENARDKPGGNSEQDKPKHKIKVNRDMPDTSNIDQSEFGDL